MYKLELSRKAEKDAAKVKRVGLKPQAGEIIKTVRENPYEPSQGFEKLTGNLFGMYSRQINYHHRFIYEILPNIEKLSDKYGKPYDGIVFVLRMWGHPY